MNVAVLDNNYWKFFGLKCDPFPLEQTEMQSLLLFPRWERFFDLLNHLCYSTNAILFITGAQGCGKTTFLDQYLLQMHESAQICRIHDAAALTTSKLLRAITDSFSLTPVDHDPLEEQLDTYLAEVQHSAKLCLLVIDNAELLSQDILQILFYFVRHQSESQMRLHVLLTGQFSLKTMLTKFCQQTEEIELINNIELEAFNLTETSSYIKECLKQAGLPAALPLPEKVLEKIHFLSKGIPQDIIKQTRKALLEHAETSPYKNLLSFFQFHKTYVMGGAIIFIILLISSIIFSKESKAGLENNAPPMENVVFTMPKPTPMLSQAAPQAPPPKPVVVIQNNLAPAPQIAAPKNVAVIKPKQKPKIVLEKQQTKKLSTQIASIASKDRLLTANPSHYTIQLIGLSSEKAMQTFIAKNNLHKNAIYFHSQLQGKDWYVLLYGQYATQQAAKLAMTQLPAAVQSQHPWVRTMANVQLSLHRIGAKA